MPKKIRYRQNSVYIQNGIYMMLLSQLDDAAPEKSDAAASKNMMPDNTQLLTVYCRAVHNGTMSPRQCAVLCGTLYTDHC
jgi:hypothetical protein